MKFLKHLKKYFIPHEENDHKPHILRHRASFVILVAVLLVEGAFLLAVSFVLPKTDYYAAILSSALIEMANADRTENRNSMLKENALLAAAAELKAEDMAERGYFSHRSPEGLAPWHWLERVNYEYSYAGENLAINFLDSKDVNEAWMDSPTHRANILNGKYTEIGIGTASGIYQGQETTFIVQFFGRPAFAETKETTAVAGKALEGLRPQVASATATPVVAQAPQEQSPPIQTSFAAVKGDSIEIPGLRAWMFASPHAMLEWLYFGLAAFLSMALAMAFFIKIKIQHPMILTNGISLLLIITFFLIANRYIAFAQTQIL